MYPDTVETFTTPGEQLVFKFLEEAARPDSKNLAWYSPEVEDREPDFLLFNQELGLMIFEVKDWALNQILQANPKTFRLNIGNRTNPLAQARGYMEKIMDLVKKDGKLYSKSKHNPKFPIGYAVIFPNINKYEYVQMGFDKILETDKIIFNDELHPQSEINKDKSGQKFQNCLQSKYHIKFNFHLREWEQLHLKQLLFPELKIELPTRDKSYNYSWHQEQIRILDLNQEQLARKIDNGHWLITGPAGCGKTLVLIHKAAFLLKYNAKIKRILIVCYNITLVSYLKRLLFNKRIPQGKTGVQVKHIFELAAEVTSEKVEFEKQGGDYYNEVLELAQLSADKHPKYDAILVDEGQDFSDSMYKLLTSVLNPETDNLTIALDENQNLYHPVQSWKELGVKAQGRVAHLPYVYRNTLEITQYAQQYSSAKADSKESPQQDFLAESFEFHGPEPEEKQFEKSDEMLSWVATEIARLVEHEKYPLSEIAVLYGTQHPEGKEGYNLPRKMLEKLEAQSLICQWVTQNTHSKKSYDSTTERVTISTVQSVKGIDYACVFLLGMNRLETVTGWSKEKVRNLMYVGVTRARYRLIKVALKIGK